MIVPSKPRLTGRRRPGGILALLLVIVVLTGRGVATAHDVPRESVMNAFFAIERDRAHLVIRVPLLLLGTVGFPANARRELDLGNAGPATQQALAAIAQAITVRENGTPLVPTEAVGRLALPSDRSFEDYDAAVEQIDRPIAPGTTIYADQGFFDAHFTYPTVSPEADFAIETTLAPELGDSLKLLVRFLPLDGTSRAYELTSSTGALVLDPRWHQAAWIFVKSGVRHILEGIDHLLFLLCLVIPFRSLRGLLPVATSFTVAHSITLLAAAHGVVPAGDWFPPLIELLIAASIVYMALENIVAVNLRRRWLITGLFGLVHGFGFSSALREDFQFAGSHLLVSLLSFNVGVELGQLAFLIVAVFTLNVLYRHVVAERLGIVILSAMVAHTGLHWMGDRAGALRSVTWPVSQSALAHVERVGVLLLIVGAVVWLGAVRLGWRTPKASRVRWDGPSVPRFGLRAPDGSGRGPAHRADPSPHLPTDGISVPAPGNGLPSLERNGAQADDVAPRLG